MRGETKGRVDEGNEAKRDEKVKRRDEIKYIRGKVKLD